MLPIVSMKILILLLLCATLVFSSLKPCEKLKAELKILNAKIKKIYAAKKIAIKKCKELKKDAKKIVKELKKKGCWKKIKKAKIAA